MRILTWVLVAVACLGVILALIGLGIYGFDFERVSADLHGDHHYEARSINVTDSDTVPHTINIKVRSLNIVVREGAEFGVEYYYNLHYSMVEYTIENGILDAEFGHRWSFRIMNWQRSRHATVTITVPYAFGGILNLESRSGNVNVQTVEVNAININARSGNITMDRVTANSINIENRSGNNRITVSGARSEFYISTSNRSGVTRIAGSRVSSRHTEGAGNARIVTISSRSGNNTLNFIA
ncbi:MAG: DUF4097 domain-containing protein [Firmicutes bacterium]|nr:DUF4097 domain-containing protein [Bacillota bacterium]